MSAILLEGPESEPLTLDEAKAYLRIEHDDDDAVITALVAAARTHVEMRSRRCLLAQTWRVVYAAPPRDGRFRLPFAPAKELAAARAIDRDGEVRVLDPAEFIVIAAAQPGEIAVPLRPFGRDGERIELDVRFGENSTADVPEPLRHAIRMLLAHWYEHRSLVVGEAEGRARTPEGFEALIAPYRGLTL